MALSRPRIAASGASLHWRSVSRSHVGAVRAINEDRVFDCPDRNLWAVADGMGGHRGGDLAAQAVVDQLRALSATADPIGRDALLNALAEANALIIARNSQLGLDSGATVVAATMDGKTLQIAWAGDSRAYLLRVGTVTQLTSDHSLVQELIDAGLLTAQMAHRHPQSNVVTRALGVSDSPEIETMSVIALPGDCIILCSDGLSRSLRDDDFSDVGSIEALADRLLANSLDRDGSDNTSLVVLEYADVAHV
jgi:serine/threonine protein phosphatase PrpC